MVGVILAALGNFSDIFASLEELGFFSYLLPFLLIFALVFGILSKVDIFGGNKAVNAIIALVVAIMSLQFSFVSQFFSELFPRVGVGLIIILAIFIIIGLFAPRNSDAINYILLGIAALVIIIVLVQTAGSVGFQSGEWWTNNWKFVLTMVAVLTLVIVILAGGGRNRNGRHTSPQGFVPIWAESGNR